jgi:Ca2+-transporting ATPase
VTTNAKNLVVGDVYALEAGMKLPADSILVQGFDVVCDQSELTGEADSVYKSVLN